MSELISRLEHEYSKYIVLKSKNVGDIIICKQLGMSSKLLFVEVKYFRKQIGRIGLGNGQGEGFQPETLIKRPDYFEHYMRWLVGSEDGSAVLVSSQKIRENAAGGVIAVGKQNNIQRAILDSKTHRFSIDQSPEEIISWLESVH